MQSPGAYVLFAMRARFLEGFVLRENAKAVGQHHALVLTGFFATGRKSVAKSSVLTPLDQQKKHLLRAILGSSAQPQRRPQSSLSW